MVLEIATILITVLIFACVNLFVHTRNHYIGGLVANGYECATIGRSILEKGGSAIDAAIAILFCEGVAIPHSMGLGGGFLMTIYIHKIKTAVTLNAREVAPLKATEKMLEKRQSRSYKGLTIAVPGELLGYWEAHQKYGKLPWRDLVQPTIELCRRGHLVTEYLARIFARMKGTLLNNSSLREVFVDDATQDTYPEGHYLKRLKLAETLEIIAREGAVALYNGKLTKTFVQDIQNYGGIITEDDMKNYRVIWEDPVISPLPNRRKLYTSPLPGSGIILTFILNVLSEFLEPSTFESLTNWQRIVETFKYGYGSRTELGDRTFVDVDELSHNLTSLSYAQEIKKQIRDDKTFNDPTHYGANVTPTEDQGTAQVSVLAPNGDAVSVSSTINTYFGSHLRSPSTGIILNNEMDDFSSPSFFNGYNLPPSPANYIRPGKRPISSMCPSIIVDKEGDVILVIGAAGGPKITTSVALVIIRTLWYGETLHDAIWASRLHHQLFPMQVLVEKDFDRNIVHGLTTKGHKIVVAQTSHGFTALLAVAVRNKQIEVSVDKRRAGQAALIR